jgi:signal transduction histidine kinase
MVPLGAGPECLGYMILTRVGDGQDWSEEEEHASLEIGRDLGRVVMHARLFERERQLVEQLQDLDRYKTDLIATISHELKNPLTSVLGHLELMKSVERAPYAGRSLTAIERSSRRLGTLVDDLLLLSKVGDPNRPLSAAPVDLGGLVSECSDLLQVQAHQRDVKVLFTPPDTPVMALGNRADLECVVSNVLGNAIKYTAGGGHIDVAVRAVDGQAVFECRDHGIGISAEDQKQLFTEFFRSSNPAAQASPGTGLGLTIVKRIVDRHQGRITVESELGAGSTFTVRLPLC